jgi:1-phosphatidylinositol-4-phosphate 5-kinase
MYEHFKANP